ncbi:SMP-30/gluconolactonase/LRE family protein [Paraperlucidibaca sp.]|jgi:sugar lactone lactonase YvrE|uniref:SMP-30/gluconolactonase/LRE family protein n=1 Tax=Paraperlucidibaca sp. TaxID=2708021 RepID=UPI00398A1FB2
MTPTLRHLTQHLLWVSLMLAPMSHATTSAAVELNIAQCQLIGTGPGPDKVISQALDTPRLLISSHDRRHFARTGEIYAYTPSTNAMVVLPRVGEPEKFRFRPQGMALRHVDSRWWLYVISHDRDLISDQHSIAVYEVLDDQLRFHELLTSPLLSAPNDIAIAPDGTLYVTNERANGASIVEWLFLQRKATVVMYRPGEGWRVAAGQFAIANGVAIRGDNLWVTQTLGEGLVRFKRGKDGQLSERTSVTALSLLDGLSVASNGDLLSSAYPSLIGLGLHWQRPASQSPTKIYAINPTTGASRVIFTDNGERISAISSVQSFDGRLYAGQLFDPYLLSCPLPASLQ